MIDQKKVEDMSRDIFFIKALVSGARTYVEDIEEQLKYGRTDGYVRGLYGALGINLGQLAERYEALGAKMEEKA